MVNLSRRVSSNVSSKVARSSTSSFSGDGKLKHIKASHNYQIAKKKLRQFDSAEARDEATPLSTQTPVAEVITQYIQHMRDVFGQCAMPSGTLSGHRRLTPTPRRFDSERRTHA